MELKSKDGKYVVTLNKGEMITLISILEEGLELVRKKSKEGNQIATMKLSDGKGLADELKRQILDEA